MHTSVCDALICMKVERFSVTMDPDLGQAVRNAAARSGVSVSRWLGEAASDHLRSELLAAALDTWEAEDGPFSDKELDSAARLLGIDGIARRAG